MYLRLGDACGAFEKIEVAAFVGLADMLRIHRAVAAGIAWRRRRPGGAPAGQLLLADMEMNFSRRHVDLDVVAGLHQRDRAADKALRRDVQDAGAVARAA